MTPIVGQWLNLVLEDLWLNKDLKVNRFTSTFTLLAGTYGPFPLESDYYRTYDLFYPLPTQAGLNNSADIIMLSPATMEEFDAEFKSPSTTNYPYEYATDLSTQAASQMTAVVSAITPGATSIGALWVYPQISVPLLLTHRYMAKQPDIVNPETSNVVPWFPYTEYLITATAAGMMGVTGDNRTKEFKDRSQEMLRPHLIMQGDEQKTTHSVRLDPRHFRTNRGARPVKAYPF